MMKTIIRWGIYFLLSTFAITMMQMNQPLLSEPSSWGYDGKSGPENWGDLDPEFSVCKTGREQSPINLKERRGSSNLPEIQFNYQYSDFEVINNGHTIEVKYAPGSFISFAGKQYQLLQFHFHTPSEHQINGQLYPLVAHLVHQSADGELAVIGVLMKEGKANDFISALWSNVPQQPGVNKVINGVQINVGALPPANQAYYNYPGSLTTPPCSEEVNWIVLKTPIEVSKAQIKQFQSLYDNNARPVQPLNNRRVKS